MSAVTRVAIPPAKRPSTFTYARVTSKRLTPEGFFMRYWPWRYARPVTVTCGGDGAWAASGAAARAATIMALPIQRSDCVCTVELLDGKGSTQGSSQNEVAAGVFGFEPLHGAATRGLGLLGRGGVAGHRDDGALGTGLDGHRQHVVAARAGRQQPPRQVEERVAVDFDDAHVPFVAIDDETMRLAHHAPPLSVPAWHAPGRSGTTDHAPPLGTRIVIVPWSAVQ